MPFLGDVVVREISADGWELVNPLEYAGKTDRFVVPAGFRTDFASVPTAFTWLVPRYGRYTKAAILHDWLCQRAKDGLIDRADADGIFRRTMRELGVAFLRRWLMWGAVRLDGAATFGVADLARPRPVDFVQFLVVAVLGLAYVTIPGAAVLVALAVFYLAEWLSYAILRLLRRLRGAARPPAAAPKVINQPRFRWTV